MSKLSRNIVFGKELEEKISNGVEQVYQVANSSYGPNAGNAMIEINFGYPVSSRDGVTNTRKVYLEDAIENMAARTIVQASEKSNKLEGDGTTGVVILSRNLFLEARKLIGSGINRMVVAKMLRETATEVIEQIDKIKIPTNSKLSRSVARISASDEAIGDMIADVIDRIGIEGNILVEEFDGVGSYDEEVKGFYFKKGFSNQYLINNLTAFESRIDSADIFITEKSLKTASDINPILEKIVIANGGPGGDIVIVGDVTDEALATLALNKAKGVINTTLVDVPVHGPMRTLFLEDIAVYTGGKVYSAGANPQAFSTDMLGGAEKVVINSHSTTIIGGEGNTEDMEVRLANLRDQLEEADNLVDRTEIKKRLSSLTGKIAIVRVGAPTEIDRGEVQLRVEDAIAATQAAIRDGIVPGGGVALARTNPKHFKTSFQSLFKTLVSNAGYNPEELIFKALEQDTWFGYDLRNTANEPINLLKAGIIDPAEVVKEIVRNACSSVSTLITTSTAITFVDRDQKSD